MSAPVPNYLSAADRWTRDLAAWRIPDEILTAAPQSPLIHPVELFRAPDEPVPETPSQSRARAALPAGGSIWTSAAAAAGRPLPSPHPPRR